MGNETMAIPQQATVEELCRMHELGFDFVIEGGEIADVLYKQSSCRLS